MPYLLTAENMNLIIPGLIGSLLAILIWEGRKYIKGLIFEREFKRFWNFKTLEILIVHPLYVNKNLPANMARIEDVLSMHELTTFFKKRKIEHKLLGDDQELPNNNDIILICSPKGNKKSEEFHKVKKTILPFQFIKPDDDSKTYCFVETATGNLFKSPMDNKDEKKIDFGLVSRITDREFNRKIFLFWGIHGVGTLGAVKFSTLMKNIKEINRRVGDKDFALIIKVPFHNAREVGLVSLETPPKLIGNSNY